jgi:pectinesterase
MKVLALLLGSASLALAVSRTSPPSGCLHVAKSGGTYTTVQSAINALSTSSTADQCVFINQGTYTEQVYIAARAAKLTIYGYTADSTSYDGNKAIITYNSPASTAGSNDASGTLRVWAANVKVYVSRVEPLLLFPFPGWRLSLEGPLHAPLDLAYREKY